MKTAALCGLTWSIHLVAASLRLDDLLQFVADLEYLSKQGFIIDDPREGNYSFVSGALVEVLLSKTRNTEWHRIACARLAEATKNEASQDDVDSLYNRASFLVSAGRRLEAEAATACAEACLRACSAFQISTAIRFGTTALKMPLAACLAPELDFKVRMALANAYLNRNPYVDFALVEKILPPGKDASLHELLVFWSLTHAYAGRAAEAVQYAERVLKCSSSSTKDRGSAWWAAGFAHLRQKEFKAGADACEQGLAAIVDADGAEIRCKLLNVLASNCQALAEEERAERALKESFEIAQKAGMELSQAIAMGMRGRLLLKRFEASLMGARDSQLLSEAKRMLRANDELNVKLGAVIGLIGAPQVLIRIARLEQDWKAMLRLGYELLDRADRHKEGPARAIALAAIVEAKQKMGQESFELDLSSLQKTPEEVRSRADVKEAMSTIQ